MPLPVAPGDHRDLPPPPSSENVDSTPVAPPRPNKKTRNDALPAPPMKDVDRESGSGVFTQRLPPLPQESEVKFFIVINYFSLTVVFFFRQIALAGNGVQLPPN